MIVCRIVSRRFYLTNVRDNILSKPRNSIMRLCSDIQIVKSYNKSCNQKVSQQEGNRHEVPASSLPRLHNITRYHVSSSLPNSPDNSITYAMIQASCIHQKFKSTSPKSTIGQNHAWQNKAEEKRGQKHGSGSGYGSAL